MVHIFHSLPYHKVVKQSNKAVLYHYYSEKWNPVLEDKRVDRLLNRFIKESEQLSSVAIAEIQAFIRWAEKPTIAVDTINQIQN